MCMAGEGGGEAGGRVDGFAGKKGGGGQEEEEEAYVRNSVLCTF